MNFGHIKKSYFTSMMFNKLAWNILIAKYHDHIVFKTYLMLFMTLLTTPIVKNSVFAEKSEHESL